MNPRTAAFTLCVVVSLFTSQLSADSDATEKPVFNALFDVAFVNRAEGWAVGRYATILHTTDGGKTWSVQHLSEQRNERVLFSVSFADPKHGIAVGSGGLILRTEDGGALWRPSTRIRNPDFQTQASPPSPAGDQSADPSVHTADPPSLETGDNSANPAGDVKATLPAETSNSSTNATVDVKDTPPADPSPNPPLKRDVPEFLPPGAAAQVSFWEARFVDLNNAWVISGGNIMHSADQGRTWRLVDVPAGSGFLGIYFLDAGSGWVVGRGGTILHTKNGGGQWVTTHLDDTWNLFDVYFLDQNVGWVAGETGLIMKTTDSGKTWTQQQSNTKQDIRQIVMVSETKGFATLAKGDALVTEDGATWKAIPTPVDEGLNKNEAQNARPEPLGIHFVDSMSGFMVGTYGLVLSTRDQGETWQYLRSERKYNRDIISLTSSLQYARWGMIMEGGYIHPVGKIGDRFGPGMQLGLFLLFRRGPVKIGSGFDVGLVSGREKLVAPAGTIDPNTSVDVDTSGAFIDIPIVVKWTFFERKKWIIRLEATAGFRWETLMVTGKYEDKVDVKDYERDRIGIGLSQGLSIGYVFAKADKMNPQRLTRHAVYLKGGLHETWTWNTSDKRLDLGKKDQTDFGTELWPVGVFGWGMYF